MAEILREKLTNAGAWRGPEIQNDSSWVMLLNDREIEEIDAALRHVQSLGREIPFKAADFPLPKLSARLNEVPNRLEEGLGAVLIRGLPRQRYSTSECELIYWGFGVHLGTPVSQNTRGHLLGHVRDEGREMGDPNTRLYQTRAKMDFHSDQLPVDVLGLFCLRTAKQGGASALTSVYTVHNVILQERPDLLDVLYQPFNIDWRGEEPQGEQPWYRCPMFSYAGGKVTSRITSRAYFNGVTRFGQELALTDVQREALDFVQEVANRPELRLRMSFAEGDMQFINNHAILHAREEFEDYDDPELKRHLLRMWIAYPEARRRQLSPILAERYSFVVRGGIPKKIAA
jgi:Taurine catabolism dioxygenase TauD, TfdA family